MATLLDVDALVGEMLETAVAGHLDTRTPLDIRSKLERTPQRRWTGIVTDVVRRHLDDTRGALREALLQKIRGVSA